MWIKLDIQREKLPQDENAGVFLPTILWSRMSECTFIIHVIGITLSSGSQTVAGGTNMTGRKILEHI